MIAKWRLWLGGGLLVAVIAAALYFPALRRQVNVAKQLTEKSAEQARRELLPPAPASSGDPKVRVKMFWGSKAGDSFTPVTVELPLSVDPVLRAKQVLNTLLAGPIDPEARTLPADAALLAFYLLPDGTGVADFSESMSTSIPSGIQSEQMAVDSITRTLEANVPQVQRLKILIHGQEMDTLAGHLDLTQTFLVNTSGLGTQPAKPSAASILTSPIHKAVETMKSVTKR
jgi:hypothetical protein